MRYFIGKVKLEHKIMPRTAKGETALDQLAAKSLSYINAHKNGFLGCVTSVYKKECLFLFAGNGDDRKIQHEIAEFWDAIGFQGEIIGTEEVCADNIRRELRSGSVDLPHDAEVTALDIFKKQ